MSSFRVERELQIIDRATEEGSGGIDLSGMSMCDAGILDNDLLGVHRTREARSGQVVVARVDDEATVKRFRRKSRRIVQLLPENIESKPIKGSRKNKFTFLGV
ncbi:MAG: LexA family protein [Gammaproteobacteria bacterium]